MATCDFHECREHAHSNQRGKLPLKDAGNVFAFEGEGVWKYFCSPGHLMQWLRDEGVFGEELRKEVAPAGTRIEGGEKRKKSNNMDFGFIKQTGQNKQSSPEY